jgi:hypothetical protein
MDDDLQYLVHFFDDERYLFETITMAGASDRDRICDAISARKGWFWVRFSPSERQGYLRRRLFVEKTLYDDYRREHGPLKERVPVFFYLIPGSPSRRPCGWRGRERARARPRPGC